MNAPEKILDAASYMEQAEEEITDLLLEGKPVDGFAFTDILDGELDRGARPIAEDLGNLLCGIVGYSQDDHTHVEGRKALEQWMRGLVERFLDSHPELIEERAADIAASADEPEYQPETE